MLPAADQRASKDVRGCGEGFVKLFCRQSAGAIIGGVVVAPIASELILPIALAVQNRITVDQLARRWPFTRRCPGRSPKPLAD